MDLYFYNSMINDFRRKYCHYIYRYKKGKQKVKKKTNNRQGIKQFTDQR